MIALEVQPLAEAIVALMPKPDTGRWLKQGELAKYLGVNVRQIPVYVAQGMPYSQPGGDTSRKFFHTGDVDKWMREQR